MKHRQSSVTSAALLLALVFFAGAANLAAAQGSGCGLLQDCEMDGFYGDSGAGSGPWKIFHISDNRPGIGLSKAEGLPGPSVLLHSENKSYDSGIYQQVQVTPGTGYQFKFDWAVEKIDGQGWEPGYQVNRRLGFDPYGGTDPNSPNVIWTGDYFDNGKIDLTMSEYARAPVITVYVRVTNPYTDKVVDVFLDAGAVYVDQGMPPIQVTPPTAVPPPATTPPQPTARPTRQPTDIPEPATEELPTDEPTQEATAAPTSSATPVHQVTPRLPTEAAISKAAATARPTRARVTSPEVEVSNNSTPSISPIEFGILGLFGIGGIITAGLMVGIAVVLLRKNR